MELTGVVIKSVPYKDNGFLLDLFTKEKGIIKLHLSQKIKKKYQNFNLFNLTTLTVTKGSVFYFLKDYSITPITLKNYAIWCGYYLNELLYRILPYETSDDALFERYILALKSLEIYSESQDYEIFLRAFETELLIFLGEFPDITIDHLDRPIDAMMQYYLTAKSGLYSSKEPIENQQYILLTGDFLIALTDYFNESLSHLTKEYLKQYKIMMRFLIDELLNHEPLKSREWFKRIKH